MPPLRTPVWVWLAPVGALLAAGGGLVYAAVGVVVGGLALAGGVVVARVQEARAPLTLGAVMRRSEGPAGVRLLVRARLGAGRACWPRCAVQVSAGGRPVAARVIAPTGAVVGPFLVGVEVADALAPDAEIAVTVQAWDGRRWWAGAGRWRAAESASGRFAPAVRAAGGGLVWTHAGLDAEG